MTGAEGPSGNAGAWEACSRGREFGQRRILAPNPQRKKEAKGQAWSVRVVDTERGDQARQEWGQRDTGREGHRKESWGVIRRKTNLFRGAERVG